MYLPYTTTNKCERSLDIFPSELMADLSNDKKTNKDKTTA